MNNWRRLEEDKENMSIDHTPTSHYLPPSPMQMSIDDSMHSWRQTHRDSPNKTYAIPTYLRQKNLSESSSGYDSSHSPKEPSGFDFRIYDDLMNIQDISMPSLISGIPSFSSFNEISFPYSPLPTSSRRSLSSSFLSFGESHCPSGLLKILTFFLRQTSKTRHQLMIMSTSSFGRISRKMAERSTTTIVISSRRSARRRKRSGGMNLPFLRRSQSGSLSSTGTYQRREEKQIVAHNHGGRTRFLRKS